MIVGSGHRAIEEGLHLAAEPSSNREPEWDFHVADAMTACSTEFFFLGSFVPQRKALHEASNVACFAPSLPPSSLSLILTRSHFLYLLLSLILWW